MLSTEEMTGGAGRNPSRRGMRIALMLAVFLTAAVISGCAVGIECCGEHGAEGEAQEHNQTDVLGGEESGNLLTMDETYDTVRKGARLIIGYHAPENTFVGTVENTTGGTLSQVRVEVHLSNGVELGPTAPVDLAPGQLIEVSLLATTEAFDGWTPHAEVGAGEHGAEDSSGESGGEHGR